MRGYSPIFNTQSKAEIASKNQPSFIELGVSNLSHKTTDCKCEKCNKIKNT